MSEHSYIDPPDMPTDFYIIHQGHTRVIQRVNMAIFHPFLGILTHISVVDHLVKPTE